MQIWTVRNGITGEVACELLAADLTASQLKKAIEKEINFNNSRSSDFACGP